jgi:hypothetical protein
MSSQTPDRLLGGASRNPRPRKTCQSRGFYSLWLWPNLLTYCFKPCRWAPDIPCILYHGSKHERAELRAKHMPHKVDLDFPIIVTSYEIVIRDMPFLRRWQWKYVVVDEVWHLVRRILNLVKDWRSSKTWPFVALVSELSQLTSEINGFHFHNLLLRSKGFHR